ncbi:hypothetical protein N9L54_02030 [Porticoccaceae bacterium]|nr:hypothetical protein [Porticoccaceae bacterium]
MHRTFQYVALAFIAVALVWYIVGDNDNQTQNISVFGPANHSESSEPAPSDGFTLDQPKSKLFNRVMPISSIQQLLSLNIGDIFSLQGVSDSSSTEIEIAIAEYDAQDNYTQMQGTTADNGLAIITVGVESVDIFIKEASGLYEFSGKGFKGEVPRIEKIVWGDDIYIDAQPAANEEEQELVLKEIEVEQ